MPEEIEVETYKSFNADGKPIGKPERMSDRAAADAKAWADKVAEHGTESAIDKARREQAEKVGSGVGQQIVKVEDPPVRVGMFPSPKPAGEPVNTPASASEGWGGIQEAGQAAPDYGSPAGADQNLSMTITLPNTFGDGGSAGLHWRLIGVSGVNAHIGSGPVGGPGAGTRSTAIIG